jgi:phosphomannomutase
MNDSPSRARIIDPIKFGTDGWRGVIAREFTFERVEFVAPRAALVLEAVYGEMAPNRTVIVGYDRRFLSEEFAQSVAAAVAAAGFNVLLSESYAPTPAFSWAAKALGALGALVITASHNPAAYSGLKVKSAFGGSVPPEVTHQIEAMFQQDLPTGAKPGTIERFNPWESYCAGLRKLVDIDAIKDAIARGDLYVCSDVMHGAASTGLSRLLGVEVAEVNAVRDPLFGGGAPEPLPKYLREIFDQVKGAKAGLRVGLVFDGDSDRIAAIDGQGSFLSSQVLIPILLEHLYTRRQFSGEVIKTVSGSNLIPKVAEAYGLSVYETPIGYKYVGDRMLESGAMLGGEESGGIGYGHHIPERDALLSALYVLEAVVQSGQDLADLYQALQQQVGYFASYDRIDLPLASLEVRDRLVSQLQNDAPTEIAGRSVVSCQTTDGYKFGLADESWLLVRFSGTEPVLRLYCEAADLPTVHQTLDWAREWANRA